MFAIFESSENIGSIYRYTSSRSTSFLINFTMIFFFKILVPTPFIVREWVLKRDKANYDEWTGV